jgi:hypothetical protein
MDQYQDALNWTSMENSLEQMKLSSIYINKISLGFLFGSIKDSAIQFIK